MTDLAMQAKKTLLTLLQTKVVSLSYPSTSHNTYSITKFKYLIILTDIIYVRLPAHHKLL